MSVKFLGDVIAPSPLQKSVCFFSQHEQKKTDRGGGILYAIQRRVEGSDSELHTSAFNGAVTVKHHKRSYDDSSEATSQRREALQYPFPRVTPEAIDTEGVGSKRKEQETV